MQDVLLVYKQIEMCFAGRDYEYKRLGTLSLLAGMDLLTREIIPRIHLKKP